MTVIRPNTLLFTAETLHFEFHDDAAADDHERRLRALEDAMDVWVGGSGLVQQSTPWNQHWEYYWALDGVSPPRATGVSLRVGACWDDDNPWGKRGIYLGVLFADVDAMGPLLGEGHDVPARVRAILRLAHADILPSRSPDWCLRDGFDVGWARSAVASGPRDPDDSFRELRERVRKARGDARLYPAALLYFFPIENLIGLTLEQVAEHLAPAFVFGKLVMEEVVRQEDAVHPWVNAVRNGGRNPLLDLSAYPPGFRIEDMDLPTRLEWEMMRAFVEGFDGSGASEWPVIAWAHLFTLRREASMGLVGVNELAEPLR